MDHLLFLVVPIDMSLINVVQRSLSLSLQYTFINIVDEQTYDDCKLHSRKAIFLQTMRQQ